MNSAKNNTIEAYIEADRDMWNASVLVSWHKGEEAVKNHFDVGRIMLGMDIEGRRELAFWRNFSRDFIRAAYANSNDFGLVYDDLMRMKSTRYLDGKPVEVAYTYADRRPCLTLVDFEQMMDNWAGYKLER